MARQQRRRERLAPDPRPPAGGHVDEAREPLPSRVEGLPELPDEALAVLETGLAVLGLDGLAGPSRLALTAHLRLLAAWNGAINLTSIREPVTAVRLHLLDSLTAVPLLRAARIDAFVDLGSGGGFPGLPARDRPAGPAGPARRQRREEGALPGHGLGRAGDVRPGRGLRRAGRVARRRPASSRALAGRHGPGGRGAGRAGRARTAAARAGRAPGGLEAGRDRSRALGRPGGARHPRWRAAEIVPVDERLGLPGHRWW